MHGLLSPFLCCRWCRPWKTTIRRCYPCTETMVFRVWLHRTQSLRYATFRLISAPTLSSSPGMARIWPLTSTCSQRQLASSASRPSTCPSLLLFLVSDTTGFWSRVWLCTFSVHWLVLNMGLQKHKTGNHILPDEDLAAFHWSLLGPEHPLASLKVLIQFVISHFFKYFHSSIIVIDDTDLSILEHQFNQCNPFFQPHSLFFFSLFSGKGSSVSAPSMWGCY